MSDILQTQGINSKGFGIIPKLVMQDRRLSAQAKAIYSYFSSYAGGGKTAFPGVSKIRYDLHISKDVYYKHFNQLKEYGYIKVEQEKSKDGKFNRNLYTLVDALPCPDFPDTASRYPAQPYPAQPRTGNQDANINSAQYKQNKNKPSFNNNSPSVPSAAGDKHAGLDAADVITEQKIRSYELRLRDNLDYDALRAANPRDAALIDEIIAIMVDVMVTPGAVIALDGENKPRELVRYNLMKLTREHIEHVLAQFNSLAGQIKRKRQYLLAMLYNSALELDAHYTNAVNCDMYVTPTR